MEHLKRANGNDLEMITEVLISRWTIFLCKIINDVKLEAIHDNKSMRNYPVSAAHSKKKREQENLLQLFPICLLINVQRVVTMLFFAGRRTKKNKITEQDKKNHRRVKKINVVKN